MKASLTPDRQKQYEDELLRASEQTLKLAFVLQKAALGQSHPDRVMSPLPAPCYLAQATAIVEKIDIRTELVHLVIAQ